MLLLYLGDAFLGVKEKKITLVKGVSPDFALTPRLR